MATNLVELRSLEEIVIDVQTIAVKAADEILKIYADESAFGVELKKDDSPLTKADKGANDIIVSLLQELPENYPIISEEMKEVPYEVRKNYNRFWLVDPLDGTKEFIKRNGEFTVNIALIEKGKSILGVVQVPVSGDIYWATLEGGAFAKKGNEVVQINANSFTKNDNGLRVVCSRSHINAETQAFIDDLNTPEKVSKGSSLKFLLMANGEAEIYPRLGPTMEWDTAAAHIILEESGGAVIEFETGDPLQYNKENLLNPYFIAQGAVIDS